jgi:L-lactate dehydrogenase complex protein LldF
MSVYNTIYTSAGNNDTDGPEKMYVILLDNGRSDLYAEEETNIALSCIRCGACLNVCPVYQNIGGYTYEVPYTGPIGSVISPYYEGVKEYKHLSFVCTLCGKCTETCPVKIPLHELMILNRKKFVEREGDSFIWNKVMKFYEYLMNDRKHLDLVNGNVKNAVVQTFGKNSLGDKKEPPKFSKHSFAKMYEMQKKKE